MKFATVLTILLGICSIAGIGCYLYATHVITIPSTALGSSSVKLHGSIKDALLQSKTLFCNFTDDNGQTTSAYIKNGFFRADITATDPSKEGSMIVKNNVLYFWNRGTAFFANLPQSEITVAPSIRKQQVLLPQKLLDVLEKYKDSCIQEKIADAAFSQPKDIKFTDFAKLFPSPSGSPSQIDKEQQTMQQYLKQYQQQSQKNK